MDARSWSEDTSEANLEVLDGHLDDMSMSDRLMALSQIVGGVSGWVPEDVWHRIVERACENHRPEPA